METVIAIVAIAGVLLTTSPTQSSIRLEAGGGLAVPMWPEGLHDSWNPGPNLVFGASFDAGYFLEGALLADVSTFALEKSINRTEGTVSGGRISLYSITANVRTYATGANRTARPYLSAGAGYHNFSTGSIRDDAYSNRIVSPETDEKGVAVVMYGGGLKFPVSGSIETLAQIYLMETWSPEHGATSRALIFRLLFRPVVGWL